MIIRVDPDDPTPVYQQLRAQIARMVAAGVLTEGTRLPTIRQLAADLGVAKGTVAKAYESLLRDGLVRAAGRNGTVVTSRPTLTEERRRAVLAEAARELVLHTQQLGLPAEEARSAVDRAVAALPEDAVDTRVRPGTAEPTPRLVRPPG